MVERIGVQAAVVPFGTGVSGALVVNATPIGMSGEVLPETVTLAASGVIDLAYGDEGNSYDLQSAGGKLAVHGRSGVLGLAGCGLVRVVDSSPSPTGSHATGGHKALKR